MSDVVPEDVELSVMRDGDGWVCCAEWPDGTLVAREATFCVAGFPSVVVTAEEQAMECFEAWIETSPDVWRKPR